MATGGVISHEVTLIACGMWDYSMTLWFELQLVRGKLKLQWPLIPYFLTRYIALGFVIGCLIFHTSTRPLNCNELYIFGNLLGKFAVALASVNLAVRAAIIWDRQWYIILLLGVLVTVEAILIGVGFWNRGSSAAWSSDLQHCVSIAGSQKHDLGLFAPYALFVDCVIVGLTVAGLRKLRHKSDFADELVRQGFSFFCLVLFFQTLITTVAFIRDAEDFVSAISNLCVVIVPTVSCHLVRSIRSGSHSASGPCATSHGSSTMNEEYSQDEVRFTTQAGTLGSSSC